MSNACCAHIHPNNDILTSEALLTALLTGYTVFMIRDRCFTYTRTSITPRVSRISVNNMKMKMHDTDVHDNQMMSVLACVRESKMTPAEAVCVHTAACGSPGGQRTGPVYTCLPLMIRISVPPLSHFWCYFSLTSADKLGASLTVITNCEED